MTSVLLLISDTHDLVSLLRLLVFRSIRPYQKCNFIAGHYSTVVLQDEDDLN